jgi:hypothetical protein
MGTKYQLPGIKKKSQNETLHPYPQGLLFVINDTPNNIILATKEIHISSQLLFLCHLEKLRIAKPHCKGTLVFVGEHISLPDGIKILKNRSDFGEYHNLA